MLKPNSVYLAISYGKPENRAFHFERDHLAFDMKQYILYPESAQTEEEKEEKSHYLYVCRKKPEADQIPACTFDEVAKQIIKEQEEELQKYADEERDTSEDSNTKKSAIRPRSMSL